MVNYLRDACTEELEKPHKHCRMIYNINIADLVKPIVLLCISVCTHMQFLSYYYCYLLSNHLKLYEMHASLPIPTLSC